MWWTRKPQIPCRVASLLASLPSLSISEEFIVKLLCALGLKKACNIIGDKPRTRLLHVLEEMAKKKKFDYPIMEKINPSQSKYMDLIIKTWGRRPIGADFMAGGGSIPFEMLRVGYGKVVVGEYNPVAYIILKASLEYPLKYGKKLVADVERYGKKVLGRLVNEVKEYYPPHPKYGQPVDYIWIRYFRCNCGLEVPATSSFWLDKEKGYALYPEIKNNEIILHVVRVKKLKEYRSGNRKEAEVEIIEGPFKGKRFKTDGYEKNGSIYCPRCKAYTITSEMVKEQYRKYIDDLEKEGYRGVHRAKLVAIKYMGRKYSEPTSEMIQAYNKALDKIRNIWTRLEAEELIPIQDIPEGEKTLEPIHAGLSKFYRLFNARQLLSHSNLIKYIRQVYYDILREVKVNTKMNSPEEYTKAIITYIVFAIGKVIGYNSILTMWDKNQGAIGHTFTRHAYAWTWDFGELDMIHESKGGFKWALNNIVKALKGITKRLEDIYSEVNVVYGDAAETPLRLMPEGGFDVLFTDPPYYGSVQHGELSDFFYVWYRLIFKDLYPEAFSYEIVPKSAEAVYNEVRVGKIPSRDRRRKGLGDIYSRIARERYERKLREIFEVHYKTLRDGGVLILWFAHRAGEAWIKTIKALIDVGFTITGLWSIRTEMGRSLHIVGKAALKSGVLIIARKKPKTVKRLSEVIEEVKDIVPKRVELLEKLNIWGPDLIMAAMAEGLRIASESWPPIDPSGKLSPEEMLDQIVNISVDVAVSHVMRTIATDIEGFDLPTRTYIIARRIYGEYIPYDDARRLIVSLAGRIPYGDPVTEIFIRTGLGIIEKTTIEGEDVKGIKILDPWNRASKGLIFKASKPPLIDYIHKAIVMYEKSSTEALRMLSSIARDACRVLRAMMLVTSSSSEEQIRIRERAVITSMASSFCEEGYIPELIPETSTSKSMQKTIDEYLRGI